MLLRMQHRRCVPDASIVNVSGELRSATASTREEGYITLLFTQQKKATVRNIILKRRSVPNKCWTVLKALLYSSKGTAVKCALLGTAKSFSSLTNNSWTS